MIKAIPFNQLVSQLASLPLEEWPPVTTATATEHAPDTIPLFIGVSPKDRQVNAAFAKQGYPVPEGQALVLNQKGWPTGQFQPFACVTDFVSAAPETVLTHWRNQLGITPDPAQGSEQLNRVLRQLTLVVEDASADSCFAFALFLARLLGYGPPPQDWVSHIRDWEQGDVHSTGPYDRSWAALQSALVHSYFSPPKDEEGDQPGNANADGEEKAKNDSKGTNEPFPREEELRQAWSASMRLLRVGLESGCPPNNLAMEVQSSELVRAKAFQAYERQVYRQSLASATRVELLVPMTGSRRELLVGAYIATELMPLGALKVLARKDPDTWAGQGYGFMALHRPNETGTGNDMVISVDPALGLTLKALWHDLESQENAAWQARGEPRPSDNPRPIVSQKDPCNPDQLKPGSPNQPWWDDQGKYTLLGAPKNVKEGGPASLLTWEQVQRALWRLYAPVNAFRFRREAGDGDGASVTLDALRREAEEKSLGGATYRYIKAHWPRKNHQSLLLCPTVMRHFAACLVCPKEQEILPEHLPPETDFDVVTVGGGFAVVHARGVFVVDDWNAQSLEDGKVHEEFRVATDTARELFEAQQALEEIQERRLDKGLLASGTSHHLNTLSGLRLRLYQRQLIEQTRPPQADHQALRERIHARFGLGRRLMDTIQSLSDIREALLSQSTALTNRIIEALTIYGFPAALLTGLFGFIFEKMTWLGSSWGVQWGGFVLFMFLAILSPLLINLMVRRWRRSMEREP